MRLLNSMDGSLRGQKQVEIIIADGGSTDGQTLKYYDILRRNGAAKVFCGKGMPMPALLNAAAEAMAIAAMERRRRLEEQKRRAKMKL